MLVFTADTEVPLSQDEATEGTMSSEALPLIFEPFEDTTLEGGAAAIVATLVPGSSQPPTAIVGTPLSEMDVEQLVTVETDEDGPSPGTSMMMADLTSAQQTSGTKLLESSVPSDSHHNTGKESRRSEDNSGEEVFHTTMRAHHHHSHMTSLLRSHFDTQTTWSQIFFLPTYRIKKITCVFIC